YYQTGLKNLLDLAVLEHPEVHHLLNVEEQYKKIDEIPFDFERRRMSVVLEQPNGKHLLVCKGAVEEMLAICNSAFDPGEDHQLHIENDIAVPMDEKMRANILHQRREYNEDGLRILLIAVKELEGTK